MSGVQSGAGNQCPRRRRQRCTTMCQGEDKISTGYIRCLAAAPSAPVPGLRSRPSGQYRGRATGHPWSLCWRSAAGRASPASTDAAIRGHFWGDWPLSMCGRRGELLPRCYGYSLKLYGGGDSWSFEAPSSLHGGRDRDKRDGVKLLASAAGGGGRAAERAVAVAVPCRPQAQVQTTVTVQLSHHA